MAIRVGSHKYRLGVGDTIGSGGVCLLGISVLFYASGVGIEEVAASGGLCLSVSIFEALGMSGEISVS